MKEGHKDLKFYPQTTWNCKVLQKWFLNKNFIPKHPEMIDTNIGQWCTNENQQIDLIKIF